MPICERVPPTLPAGPGHVGACWLLDADRRETTPGALGGETADPGKER